MTLTEKQKTFVMKYMYKTKQKKMILYHEDTFFLVEIRTMTGNQFSEDSDVLDVEELPHPIALPLMGG